MARNWEQTFIDWTAPLSGTEETRAENAVGIVRNAIKESSLFDNVNVTVFVHGSYRNNTNVLGESDVDVGVVCTDSYFTQYPEGMTDAHFGNKVADYTYSTFKTHLGRALTDYLGKDAVTREPKTFAAHETSYHLDADVTPFFEHRRYKTDGSWLTGVEMRPDNTTDRIINWPEQHNANGIERNNATRRCYKGMVRVLKNLRNEMAGESHAAAEPIKSFLTECLVYNVATTCFETKTWYDDVRATLLDIYQHTASDEACKNWLEVSELKYLFHSSKPWTRQQVRTFIEAAWGYVGFQ